MKITIHNINEELERLIKVGVPTDKAIVWFRKELATIILDQSVKAYEREAAAIALITFDETTKNPS